MSKQELQRKSNRLVIAAVALVMAIFASSSFLPDGDIFMIAAIGVFMGAAMCWFYGLVYYCQSKNQPGSYAVLGFVLGFIGLIIIACLPDKSHDQGERPESDEAENEHQSDPPPRRTAFM